MRPEFRELVELGQLPADDDLDEDAAQRYVDAVDALQDPPTAEEVIASGALTVVPLSLIRSDLSRSPSAGTWA
jgi:hypothetical protein